MAARQPSFTYLYERIGNQKFQQLCSALLIREFPDVRCFPVGQKDGGRDATKSSSGAPDFYIFQVKWTSDGIKSPVAWLESALKDEAENIRRLAREGAKKYILLTNLTGTSAAGSGSIDRLDKKLREYEREFGVAIHCLWRTDIDARVDNAPKELKWTYVDMLAGHDLVRAMIEADPRYLGTFRETSELVGGQLRSSQRW